jgi:hypothetical protein
MTTGQPERGSKVPPRNATPSLRLTEPGPDAPGLNGEPGWKSSVGLGANWGSSGVGLDRKNRLRRRPPAAADGTSCGSQRGRRVNS